MLIRIANMENLDQKQPDLGLTYLSKSLFNRHPVLEILEHLPYF